MATPDGSPQRAATSTWSRGWAACVRIARGTVGYLEGVLGADRFRIYVEHQARSHPGVPPLTEREFWRDHSDWQEKNPQGRCC